MNNGIILAKFIIFLKLSHLIIALRDSCFSAVMTAYVNALFIRPELMRALSSVPSSFRALLLRLKRNSVRHASR